MTGSSISPAPVALQTAKGRVPQRYVRCCVVLLCLLLVAFFISRDHYHRHKRVSLVPSNSSSLSNPGPPSQNLLLGLESVQNPNESWPLPSPSAHAVRGNLSTKAESSYVAICTTAKDQNIDICEWLQYHEQVVGVGMFYIMDHGSSTPLIHTIRECFDVNRVRYTYFARSASGSFKPQLWAYSECLQKHGHKHRWMAFIDVDEFIVIKQANISNINQFMQQYEGYGGLVMNWLMFGSSGLTSRPQGGVLANYNMTLFPAHPQHTHIKSMVNTEWAIAPYKDPHHFHYIKDHAPVNSNFTRVTGPRSHTVRHDRIVLHHYVLKSLEDYQKKTARGSAMGNFKTSRFFQQVDKECKFVNTDAQLLAKKIDPHKYDALTQQQNEQLNTTNTSGAAKGADS